MNVKLNFIPSPPDNRDYKVKLKTNNNTTTSVDLSSYQTKIKDQGPIGSCTAFAVIALMEYNIKRFNGSGKDLEDVYSEMFTYYVTRVKIGNWGVEDTGAYMREAFQAVRRYGACPEKLWPYSNDYRSDPSAEAYRAAEDNQILTYARLDTGESSQTLEKMKKTLQEGYCFVGGFACFSSIWREDVSITGIIPPPQEVPIGGHAVCFVGYDDSRSVLKFKNSWGPLWGDKGYGYLPYEYVLKGLLWDIWTAFTQENFSSVIGIDQTQNTEQIEDINIIPSIVTRGGDEKQKMRRLPL